MTSRRSSTPPARRAAGALYAALPLLLLGGCGVKMSQDSVRELFDAADRAFLAGDVNGVCDLRSDGFQLDFTHFELARGRTVADRAEADAVESQAVADGRRVPGKREALDRRQFCMMAYDGRELARAARIERGPLEIDVDPSGTRATVRVRYTVVQPEYAVGESAHGQRDESRGQVASRRTDSDEESVIVLDGGALKFASTRATSWSYLVPAVRDTRL
jgi:hypothetical protein